MHGGMRILMLGWEFPPYIVGGLGTACHGLTRGLDRAGHKVVFVLPKAVDRAGASPARVMGTESEGEPVPVLEGPGAGGPDESSEARGAAPEEHPERVFRNVEFREIPATLAAPYEAIAPARFVALTDDSGPLPVEDVAAEPEPAAATEGVAPVREIAAPPGAYGTDVVGDAERYARLAVAIASREAFDVVHAHDWLTFPAGIAVARLFDRPLVVHVHSTEVDRSGSGVNPRIFDVERAGMLAADRVIAVSEWTKSIIAKRYGIAPSKIDVVHNGVDAGSLVDGAAAPGGGARGADARGEVAGVGIPGRTAAHAWRAEGPLVLYLGRITSQKGPEYFLHAARRVLERLPNARFVLAGSGDMATRMIELANEMGIGRRVMFTGFLRRDEVSRLFELADCYVMPSVSEPFGIAALEAVAHGVPTIVSKSSGVSEVLASALKVDFWDTDDLAEKIVAVVTRPALAEELRARGREEIGALTWESAAAKVVGVYARAVESHANPERRAS